jgi:KDO2-lipid IV(A) lauroyltransferase
VSGLPDGDPRVRALARASVRNFGRMAIDFLAACTIHPVEVRAWVMPEGESYFQEVIAYGRGVIIAMPHLGSWDVAAAFVPAYGIHVTAVVEGHAFAQIVEGARRYQGVKLVERDRSLRALYAALARNESIVLLSDIAHGAVQTVYVPFFGRPAPFPAGPARLALRTGAPILVVFCVRLGETSYHIEALPPIWPDLQASKTEATAVERLTAALAQGFQQVVQRYPEQWYPYHRIWEE